MTPDEAIERAVNEIHCYFIGGAGSVSESIVRSEKEVIRKAIRGLLASISHADIVPMPKEPRGRSYSPF